MIRFFCRSYLRYRWMHGMKVFTPSLKRVAELGSKGFDLSKDDAEEFSRILQCVRVEGVWKWTAPGRLKAMDDLLSECISASELKSIRMLDVGASDGITSLDTYELLTSSGHADVSISVLDRTTKLYACPVALGTVYCTSRKKPVLFRCGRLGLCLEPMEGLEGIAWNWLAHCLTNHYERQLAERQLSEDSIISLVHPNVSSNESLEVVEGDLFDSNPAWTGKFNAVRASNVLNRSYFSDDQITEALAVLHGYLKSDGLLIVSRNDIGPDSEVELGAIWARTDTGFSHIRSLETPPEVFSIVEEFAAARK